MTTTQFLPSADHYQYFSHLFHSQALITYDQYCPLPDWQYPQIDLERFQRLFGVKQEYIQHKHVIDLGCHTGYLSYIMQRLGARSTHGVNARAWPLAVADWAFEQLGCRNYCFEQHNIEDLAWLKTALSGKQTLLLAGVLEHLKNPFALLDIITASDVQHLIMECHVAPDLGFPCLKYYFQTTESAFSAYDDDVRRKITVGCTPNLPWLEQMLYHLGWHIQEQSMCHCFSNNWFGTPGLEKFFPKSTEAVFLHCTKFQQVSDTNNFEY